MSRWEEALESQVRLLNFWRSERGARYAEGFAEDMIAKGREEASAVIYATLPKVEGDKLERAEPVYVDENVMDLLEVAARSIRPEALVPDDVFASSGFAVLPRQFDVLDRNGKRCSLRAISWGIIDARRGELGGPVEPVLHVGLYSHIEDEDDYNQSIAPGQMERTAYKQAMGGNYSLFHADLIRWGVPPEADDRPGLDDHFFLFLLAFFRLAEQRVTVRERAYGDRASRKRLRRLSEDNDGVLVVRLRRAKTPPTGEEVEDGNWSCRWAVSGHWRNQFYPSVGAHRQIWVAPYVKGPEDKPLRLHAGRVFEFTR